MTRIILALCCAVTIAAVGCSGRSPNSPSAGATITGNVVATRAAAATSSPLTVGVSGTNLSTGVEPSGSFTLGGVPPGDVQLTFSSDGATSTVSVANVADQEVVDLQVIIADGAATVLNEARGGKARGVTIRKFTNGERPEKAPGPAIPVGSPVSWTYVITNTSPFTFTSLSVTDDQGVDVACPRELPPPGTSIRCTGSGTAVAGQYRNVGSVIATAGGKVFADRDESFYFGVPAGRGVTIRKLTNGEPVSQAPGPSIPVGSPVSWTYVITNASVFTFTSLSVTDDQGVVVACPRELPPPGASIRCTGSGTAVAGQYHNVGMVTATGGGNVYTDSDDSFYFGVPAGGGVRLRKFTNGEHVNQAPGPKIQVGSPVSWTYVVANTTASTFTSLSVTDDRGVTVVCPRELPPPGASITCTGSGTAVAGQYHNVGMVTATGGGNVYTDRDDSFYFGETREEPPSEKEKVELCHRTGNGSFHMIEVSVNAEPAHRKHGDGKPGEPVPGSPGRVFTASCGVR